MRLRNGVLFFVFIFGLGAASCAHISYQSPSGEKFEYSRNFSLVKITGFELSKDKEGIVTAKFDSVESADSKLVDAASALAQTALSVAKKAP